MPRVCTRTYEAQTHNRILRNNFACHSNSFLLTGWWFCYSLCLPSALSLQTCTLNDKSRVVKSGGNVRRCDKLLVPRVLRHLAFVPLAVLQTVLMTLDTRQGEFIPVACISTRFRDTTLAFHCTGTFAIYTAVHSQSDATNNFVSSYFTLCITTRNMIVTKPPLQTHDLVWSFCQNNHRIQTKWPFGLY